ncbi:MAG TPA: phosphate ABC transporter permease subunit PstC [Gaiellales bacterium]|jgi:phosphate transport system permease protein
MSTLTQHPATTRLKRRVRVSDLGLHGATLAGALIVVLLLAGIVLKVVDLAHPAISRYGLGFITSDQWNPVTEKFGAWDFLVGTLVSSIGALVLAGPIAVGIAIYLTELSPRWVRQPLAIGVELLAAIPSVVLGLWGILVLGPFAQSHLEPWLNSALGWIPLFSGSASPVGMLPAILVLALMMLPIVTSISREVLLTAPRDMRDGALALGVTRWEMIRGIVLPYARPGIAAAMMLGLARALGEAIAVTQVIGSASGTHWSLFSPADTIGSRIASQYQGATSNIQGAAIAYLAVILLVISLLVNVSARVIVSTSVRRAAR